MRTFENYISLVNVSNIYKKYDTIGLTLITEPPFIIKSVSKTQEDEELVYAEVEPAYSRKRRFAVSPNIYGSELIKKGEFGPFMLDLNKKQLKTFINCS